MEQLLTPRSANQLCNESRQRMIEEYPKHLKMYNDRIDEIIKQMVRANAASPLSDDDMAYECATLYQSLLESYQTRMSVYKNPPYNRLLTEGWQQAYLQDIFHSNPIAEILFCREKLNEEYKAKFSHIEQMCQRTQEAIDGYDREDDEDDFSHVGAGLREMTYDPEQLIGQPWVKDEEKFGVRHRRRSHRRCPRCNRRK